jgi:hypothetical protein
MPEQPNHDHTTAPVIVTPSHAADYVAPADAADGSEDPAPAPPSVARPAPAVPAVPARKC